MSARSQAPSVCRGKGQGRMDFRSLDLAHLEEVGSQSQHGNAGQKEDAKVGQGRKSASADEAVSEAVDAVGEGIEVCDEPDPRGELLDGKYCPREEEKGEDDEVHDQAEAGHVLHPGGKG